MMRILIVDDEPARYRPLIPELEKLGVTKGMIDFASCSAEAYDYLSELEYDLLILDILIPLDKIDEPSHLNSINILYEITEGDNTLKPRKIIGITSDITIAGEVSKDFEEHTWSIIQYRINDTEWVKKICNCSKYLLRNNGELENDDNISSVDLVIICALETPELEAVLNIDWNWQVARPIDDLVFVRDGHFFSNGRKYTVAAAFASRMGMVATALKSFALISRLSPKVIGMTGVCAGLKEKVSIGDVLLADPAWDFQSGKRVKDNESSSFSIAPHQLHSDYSIRSHVEQLRSDKEFLNALPLNYAMNCEFNTKILIGPVASGSAVLADGDTILEIKKQQRDLIGVEMEIYGLYTAAVNSSPAPKVFALKGVCDYADPDKQDIAQSYAAYASANVMKQLFEQFGYRIIN